MKNDIKQKDGYFLLENPDGPILGMTDTMSSRIIQKDGLYFKDLSGTGELLPYEDWRLDVDERAKDLAARLSVEEIAGLMLYSSHQMVPFTKQLGFDPSTYNGKEYEDSGAKPWELTDQQKQFLERDKIRHVLAMKLESAETAARWNNELQAFAEQRNYGIPVNISSDPRHGATTDGAEYKVGSHDTSKWPEALAMAATFSPELCEEFGRVIAKEYRAMGISTALSPQIDLATEPRWMRFGDTFGEHTGLVTDMARAYCDGLQTTEGSESGWGNESVIAMAKHWPGGGTGEAGRDAHYRWGKYAVYPGNNFKEHLKPFTEGAFRLNGPTKSVGAVMPYYTVSWQQDKKNGENVGNAYNEYIIKDLLREQHGYDGVVCTDWGITGDAEKGVEGLTSHCFGVEELSEAERHLKILMNGMDQFGGNDLSEPVLEAYHIGCERYGEADMRARFERSAVRLLRGIFRCGLFENPYLDPEESAEKVGCEEHRKAGYEAQLRSIVLLKNQNGILPLKEKPKVYIPQRKVDPTMSFFRVEMPGYEMEPVPKALLEEYFEIAETPEEADMAFVFIETPITNPYDVEDLANGGNGYFPVSLQYRPYKAETARAESIAGGDPDENFKNRTYRDKTTKVANEGDLDNVLEMRRRMGDKPVIVVAQMTNPVVPAEFEPVADAIIAHFGVETRAILDILSGRAEPSGLLPIQLPKDMETVEAQAEDVALDMTPYTDTLGNTYDFGFGMNYNGIIHDARCIRYQK